MLLAEALAWLEVAPEGCARIRAGQVPPEASFSPGASAVKLRPTRSGTWPVVALVRLNLFG
ncbi:hypothetical protein ACFYRN_43780, partial [Streptomyces sp. NPDC005227]|uniref:hypothetical protein n=1 Tax=Streptomyces sp. NPDC005227 TaxID=3364707 RepID=UPI00368289E8